MKGSRGFTIVELLVVIVVIGILAAISIVAYSGIQNRAIIANLTSDLSSAATQLRLFQVDNGSFPSSNDCSASPAAGSLCLKSSAGTSYQYVASSAGPASFCLTATKVSTSYNVGQNNPPLAGPCPVLNLNASDTGSYPGVGSVWYDVSGGGNSGTLLNGVSYLSTAGGALSFDGIDDYITLPDSPQLHFGTNDFTVSFWCYRTAYGYQGGSYLTKGPYGTPGFDSFDGVFRVDTTAGYLAQIGLNSSFNVW
ncbi:MAG: prepilin-type N-terminal cleavage/methylation domain-containing protein, partial [Candidatus Saccharibacteria bacterium]